MKELAAKNRNTIIGLLALGIAAIPILHIGNSALGMITAVSILIHIIRYGLLIAIGALTRNLPIKIATITLAALFLLLDVLAVADLFNIYGAVAPQPQPFIYFQF